MSKGITEDQLKQIQESGLQIAATELTIVGGERQILDQGRITESFMILEHGAKIESLNKEIEKKDDEIVALQKALQEVREKNDELQFFLNCMEFMTRKYLPDSMIKT